MNLLSDRTYIPLIEGIKKIQNRQKSCASARKPQTKRAQNREKISFLHTKYINSESFILHTLF